MRTKKRENIIIMIIVDIIILWPLLNSFFGVDMVDTGYYLYQYENPMDPNIPYTYYLAVILGAAWNKIFGYFGLWGLNILEVFIEYLLCYITYRILSPLFGKINTLAGILICMLAISTYVNIFNYHQFNMFFCTLLTLFMLKGFVEEKKIWIFASGCSGMLAVASRMPSILSLCCVFAIIYWAIVYKKGIKETVKNIGAFLAGYVAIAAIYALFLKMSGAFDRVISEIFRLNSLGKSSSGSYSSSNMLTNFINDTVNGVEAALVFVVCAGVIFLAYEYFIAKKEQIGFRIVGVLVIIAGIAGMFAAIYLVADAPPYVQLTSFSWFLYGIVFLIPLFYIVRGLFWKKEQYQFDGIVMFLSEALVLLCFVGSAARAKHVIMGLWLILPFLLNKISSYRRQRDGIRIISKKKEIVFAYQTGMACILIVLVVFGIAFARFLSVTNNFDSPNRLKLTSTINNEKMEFVFTTEREAQAVNEVLQVVQQNAEDETTLMVVGNSLLFYYLTDLTPYVKIWVTGSSYLYDSLKQDLEEKQNAGTPLPIIIEAKTNTYEGFSEEKYQELADQIKNSHYREKGQLITEFRNNHQYNMIFENDYFSVYYTK